MASALDIITRALRKLNVLSARENPNADDAQHCLDELNAILAAYVARGCETAPNAQLAAVGSVLTLDSAYHQALVDVLAERISEPFGIPLSAKVIADAGRGDRLILKEFVTRATFGVDNALQVTRMSGPRTSWDGVA